MALLRPAWMQATGADAPIEYSASLDRRVLRAIFSREGVNDVAGGHLRVQQRAAGANFSVDIAAGECAIYGDDVSDQGAYQCTSTATENRTIPSPPGSGSRTHRVVARVRDKMHNGIWAGYDWVIEVLQDTGSGTPAVPASAIPLARVTVAAGQSSVTNANIADDRQPWSVGTPARQGSFMSAIDPNRWDPEDPVRPPTYHVNPDGWVSLAGFVRRIVSGYSYDPGTHGQVLLGTSSASTVPSDIRPPSGGYRDFIGVTSVGPVQYAVMPNGTVTYRFFTNVAIVAGSTWFSFDGCGYRL